MNKVKIIVAVLIIFVFYTISQNVAFAQSKVQRVCPEDSVVCIIAEEYEQGDSVTFYVENLSICEITVTLELTLENMVSSQPSPYTEVYPPRSRHRAFVIEVESREGENWKYGSDYFYMFGDFRAIHDSNQIYQLPYLSGKRFNVIQGYNDTFTHKGESAYAIDFDMPSGTPVCASREGTVVQASGIYDRGADDINLRDSSNYIMIRHKDGTIGYYLHLKEDGLRVTEGQKVTAGQAIGFSGNTGYSRGAHLHFEVFKPVDGKSRETIPVEFDAVEGKGLTLIKGESYTAP